MKTSFIKTVFAVILAGTLFTSCEKSENESSAPATSGNQTSLRNMLTPEMQVVMATKISEYQKTHAARGAEFIPAFFGGQGFGMFKDLVIDWSTFTFISGEYAGFDAMNDDNDFYRLNPDSTVTMHLSSNAANGFYTNYATTDFYEGVGNCTMTVNYTGPVEKIDVPFPPFTLYFINLGVTNAAQFQGAGRVSLNGTGAQKTLTANWTVTTSGNSNLDFRIR